MKSLAAKLTLALLAVGLTGTLLVALAVGLGTRLAFDDFVGAQDSARLVPVLEDYYRRTGSWAGVTDLLYDDRPRYGRGGDPFWRTTLLDADGKVVAGRPSPGGRRERAEPILVDGETVGYLLGDSGFRAPPPGTPEFTLLDRLNRGTILGALGAMGAALLLAAFLGRGLSRPINELTAATRRLAQGELGHQVEVRSQDELGELARAFNSMSAELERTNRLRRQMTADIAHDLRTPLSVILGYTEALSEGKLDGSDRIFGVLHKEARHLQHLVEDLRTLSRVDAGELPLKRAAVAPLTLLERAAQAHAVAAEERGIALAVEVEGEPAPIEVDDERMAQVLGNLVSNALRHTPSGGRVTLAARGANGAVRLQVRDSGEGIPPDNLPHIFERFYRGDPARGGGESGLGLAIARALVEAHGGTIEASSRPGAGATFTISMPAARSG